MSGLTENLELLNQIERYFNIAVSTTVTGLQLLDTSECRGRVHLKFECPDRHFPEYGFSVEFRVSRDFFEKNLKRLLEIDV
jgi:hypothetical protein